jgi:hypothetical protein
LIYADSPIITAKFEPQRKELLIFREGSAMKRCSQCEFIYEDDQGVCDMDGHTLVDESAFSALPTPGTALMLVAQPTANTWSLNGIGLPAGVGLLLAMMFSLGFYVSSDLVSAENGIKEIQAVRYEVDPLLPDKPDSMPAQAVLAATSTTTRSEILDPPPEEVTASGESNKEKGHRTEVIQGDRRLTVARGLPPLPRLRPLPRLASAKPIDARPEKGSFLTPTARSRVTLANPPADQSAKKDSKVGSFFKKTGRLLSKPFKL